MTQGPIASAPASRHRPCLSDALGRCRRLAACVVALLIAAPSAQAALSTPELLDLVRQTVAGAAERTQAQLGATVPGLKVQADVGPMDPSWRLAPCEQAEPYLPTGVRPWGPIRIGLRCTQGPVRWNVFVPAVIRVQAPVVVATAALPVGHVLQAEDLGVQEAELTGEAGATLGDPKAAVGRALAFALRPGQALRTQHLRARAWFAAGEPVTLTARGAGFAITTEGVALSPGTDGQSVRVRLDNGRVVSGQAIGPRRVEVMP